jgi:hypothetical protein
MPRLKLKDGYTLPFSTEPVEGVVVSGSYRPALPDTLGNYFFNRDRAIRGELQIEEDCKLIAGHLVEWDVTDEKDNVTKPTLENVKRISSIGIINQLVRVVTTWKPSIEEAAKN